MRAGFYFCTVLYNGFFYFYRKGKFTEGYRDWLQIVNPHTQTGAGGRWQLVAGAVTIPDNSKRRQREVKREREEATDGHGRVVVAIWHILGLVGRMLLWRSCNWGVGMNSQRIVCIQLPVGWTDHLWHRLVLSSVKPLMFVHTTDTYGKTRYCCDRKFTWLTKNKLTQIL